MGLRTEFREIFFRKPTVSFCITCRNRMWQIEQTLPLNLKDNYANRKNVEFILVNFASEDGLDEWVRDNFREELRSGYLKYYYTDKMGPWHMSVAKNTAHMLATKEVVVNLDCDNFTGPDGGRLVGKKMVRKGVERTVLHLWSGDGNGSHGRIALSKANFLKVGGYDESFEPFSYDDVDLYMRCAKMGLRLIRVNTRKYTNAIPNRTGEGVLTASQKWEEMDERNREISNRNIAERNFTVNRGKKIGVRAERRYAK